MEPSSTLTPSHDLKPPQEVLLPPSQSPDRNKLEASNIDSFRVKGSDVVLIPSCEEKVPMKPRSFADIVSRGPARAVQQRKHGSTGLSTSFADLLGGKPDPNKRAREVTADLQTLDVYTTRNLEQKMVFINC